MTPVILHEVNSEELRETAVTKAYFEILSVGVRKNLMQCHSCGHQNRADARHCSGCGQTLRIRCARCGNDNLPTSHFCDGCGISLAELESKSYTPPHLVNEILNSQSALEGEVKQVTVLFCDIENSTALAHRVGAETMHDLLNVFFELASSQVHRFDGTINQFLGDGFMALFGAPVAHEDHLRHALLAALSLREKSQETAALADIQFRMGVNTGTVVVGKIGDNLRMDYTAVGDTTNLAARLQALAKPGHIYVGPNVYAAASEYFDFKPVGGHALKGIEGSVEVYDLLGGRDIKDRQSPARSFGVASPLVGRDKELALLEQELERLIAGKGGVRLLTGEPGAGKSRLIAEIRSWRDAEQLLWLEGRSVSYGRTLSYWPLIEVLKQCFDIQKDDSETEIWRKLEEGLDELFMDRTQEVIPYLASVLALRMPAEYEDRVKYLDGQGMRRQVFTCFRQLFERLAQQQPVVLMLEDWHWADQSSVELVEHLLPLTQTSPLLVFYATRPDPERARVRILNIAAKNPELHFEELNLGKLTEQQSAVLLSNLVRSLQLPVELREQILRKTEGNPFFIEEVIRSLVADGTLVSNARGQGWQLTQQVEKMIIPSTVQALLLARIDRLDEEVKQTLKLASVIGRHFFERVLKAISDTGIQLEGSILSLEHAELIRLGQSVLEIEYVFNHALVQEAAYGSILAEQRRMIHQRIAQAIETLFEGRLDEFTSLLAHHYTRAEVWDKAQEYLFKAGDQAGRMAGDSEALEHFRQAEEAYIQAFGDKLSQLQRASLARKVGAALHATGHYDEALKQYRRALAQLGWRYPKSRLGIRFNILKVLGGHLWRQFREWIGWPVKRRLAVEIAEEISIICHSMGWIDYFLDKERMLLNSLLELKAGETSHYAVAEARGLSSIGFGLMTYDLTKLARKYHIKARPVAERSGHPSAQAFARFSLGFLDYYEALWDESESNLRTGGEIYWDSGDIRRWGGAILMLSFITSSRGDLAGTLKLAAELERAGQDAADPQLTSWGFQIRAYAEIETTPLNEAIANMRQGVALAAKIHAWDNFLYLSSLLGKGLIRQGKIEDAVAILAEASQVMKREKLFRPFDQVELLTGCALASLLTAEESTGPERNLALEEARRACDKALKFAHVRTRWLPEAQRMSGTVYWLSGNERDAQDRWRESIASAEASEFPIEKARTLLEIGRRLREIEPIEQAIIIFRETGANVCYAAAMYSLAGAKAHIAPNPGTIIPEYEEAILALESMNASYDLAQARDQLATLKSDGLMPD